MKPQIDTAFLNQIKNSMIQRCEESENKTANISFAGFNLIFECREIEETDIETLLISKMVNAIYYRKYDCSFIECLKKGDAEQFSVIISKTANDFFKKSTIILFLFSFSLFALLFWVSGNTLSSRFAHLGILLVIVSAPTFFLSNLISTLEAKFIPQEAVVIASPIVSKIFFLIEAKYKIVAIIGFCLLFTSLIVWVFNKFKKKTLTAND